MISAALRLGDQFDYKSLQINTALGKRVWMMQTGIYWLMLNSKNQEQYHEWWTF
jgi:predicted component of type VI protein secretion system